MSKLTLCEKKKLKLVNVLIKKVSNIKIEEVNKEIEKFINNIEVMKIQTKGPLITKSSGTNIDENGNAFVNYELMIQTVRKTSPRFGMLFKEIFSVEDCLYIRYEGLQEEIGYAQSKLDIHIWENKYTYFGEEYTVYLEIDSENMLVDIFRPIVR